MSTETTARARLVRKFAEFYLGDYGHMAEQMVADAEEILLAERDAEIERLRAERDQTVADALPALSAEIKRLRAELDEAKAKLADCRDRPWLTDQS